ncbi:hypothetical protein L6452_15111 [Arctium lappa]|uniref:Uncharacterized protein n=1 Tax=Arctium lappa TaxID=4217 RepID=A0ACB9CMU8_ARCLA|nr:hypothetical protein L6452_15111 [Arctium lappa]
MVPLPPTTADGSSTPSSPLRLTPTSPPPVETRNLKISASISNQRFALKTPPLILLGATLSNQVSFKSITL